VYRPKNPKTYYALLDGVACPLTHLRLGAGPFCKDRACITAAAAKLPQVAALKIEQSRVVPAGQQKSKLYHVTVEIDTSLAGQTSTYVFNCIRDGLSTIIQPLGMR
jgi:hypothetical protein